NLLARMWISHLMDNRLLPIFDAAYLRSLKSSAEGIMDSDDVIHLPIKGYQRAKNQVGRHAVRCTVSGRWLQFPKQGSIYCEEGELMRLHVMTEGRDEKDRIICELVVTREDLLRVIAAVAPAPKK
ncbi:MAG: hypothetical protein ACREJN_16795, partial [Nitrospiraceae bacterium]